VEEAETLRLQAENQALRERLVEQGEEYQELNAQVETWRRQRAAELAHWKASHQAVTTSTLWRLFEALARAKRRFWR
jgi:sirohydrochlorin ferrochelatase